MIAYVYRWAYDAAVMGMTTSAKGGHYDAFALFG
jgi:hypothetical protein